MNGCSPIVVVGSTLLLGACAASPTAGLHPVPRDDCPTARQLWPVQEWTSSVNDEAAGGLARALLDSAWIKGYGARKPRLLFAPARNKSNHHIRWRGLTKLIEQQIFDRGRVTLLPDEAFTHDAKGMAALRLDAVASITIDSKTKDEGKIRHSGFILQLDLLPPGARRSTAPLWKAEVRIMRRLVAATLPDGCLQPDWICESTSSAGTPSGGCVAAWGCLNGDFKLSCGSKLVAGQRDCSCLGSGTPRKVKAPDFCSQGSLPRHIVNKLCGWRLPAAGR